MQLKTLQWNIGGAYVDSGAGKYDELNIGYIKEIIASRNPDICFLQEVHTNEDFNQTEFLASELGYHSVFDLYDDSHIAPGQKLNQAILSKTPLTDHEFTFFHNPRWEVKNENGDLWVTQ